MKTKTLTSVMALMALAGVAFALVGCSSATPTDTPGVDRMGQYILRQFGPELWTVLGYRFADSQIGDEWMILEVGMTTPGGQVATVEREDIWLRAPDGTRLPMPTQREFNEAYGSLRPAIAKANVNSDPMDYFPPRTEPCDMRFFVTPGGQVSFDEVVINERRACFERLFFKVPGGIQAGRWVFAVDQPESEIRIPFELGE